MTSTTHRPVAAFVAFMREYCPVTVAYATDGTREIGDRASHDEWERACVPVFSEAGDERGRR